MPEPRLSSTESTIFIQPKEYSYFIGLFGLLGQDGTLIDHGIARVLKRPGAPAFDPAHRGVEFAFQRVVDWD